MRLLSHPFRLGGDGSIATVEQGSDAARAQEVGALIMTVRGERELVSAFGVTDPAFGYLDTAEVAVGIELFGPPVDLTDVTITYPAETTERVVLTWENSEGAS